MKPLSDNLSILDNDRTHKGIRTCPSESTAGKFNAPLHHGAIKLGVQGRVFHSLVLFGLTLSLMNQRSKRDSKIGWISVFLRSDTKSGLYSKRQKAKGRGQKGYY
jgi:hypothetical protein